VQNSTGKGYYLRKLLYVNDFLGTDRLRLKGRGLVNRSTRGKVQRKPGVNQSRVKFFQNFIYGCGASRKSRYGMAEKSLLRYTAGGAVYGAILGVLTAVVYGIVEPATFALWTVISLVVVAAVTTGIERYGRGG